MKQRCAVPLQEIRRTWDPGQLGFATTAELPDLEGLVGQERAVNALNFGLAVRSPGYNIFVAGPSGTGKTSYSTTLVRKHAQPEAPAQDWVYVHNFDRPDEPVALAMPSGGAPLFAREMDELIASAGRAALRALETKEYKVRREEIVRRARRQMARVMEELESTARDQGFVLSQTEQGLVPVPTLQGQPLTEEQWSALPTESRNELSDRGQQLRTIIAEVGRRTWELEKSLKEELAGLDATVAGSAMEPLISDLKERYKHLPQVLRWLTRVESELVGHSVPAPSPATPAYEEAAAAAELELEPEARPQGDPAQKFRVNVFVHHSKKDGAPVVVENNPSYFNLFGKAEMVATPDGGAVTSVLHLKAGALHRANGGYLILQAADLLRSPVVWETLKRALTTREARVEMPEQENRNVPIGMMLRPQPIPLSVKVILIGGAQLYRALYTQDDSFRKLFKIKAEFEPVMDASPENVEGYTRFMAQVCRREGLRHLTAAAVAQVLEHSHRLADEQHKLSAQFNEVVEVIYEANAWAAQAGSDLVDGVHIDRAIEAKAERSASPELHLREMIERGSIMVDVDGWVVGQVNGLTVMNVGDHTFGSPCRITARVYTGHKEIMHIEREIDMTGQIHDKGLFTLTGFLGDRFAQDKPLAFSASIAFEQTYIPVDGDSASSTELYALLSALAEAPIDQGIAVTGSVNQRGQIQTIGGVNEKIEGYFGICKAKGLTGRQGVMIPKQNVPNLMLSEEVLQAVRDGKFSIWAVGTIEEGIEILTGMPAGHRGSDGRYASGTLFDRVDRRIESLARNLSLWH